MSHKRDSIDWNPVSVLVSSEKRQLVDAITQAKAGAANRLLAENRELIAALKALLDDVPYQEQADDACECGEDGASTDCPHQLARNLIAKIKEGGAR